MKKIFNFTSIVLSFVFASTSIIQTLGNNALKITANAEEEENVVSYATILKTCYERENYKVFEEQWDNTDLITIEDNAGNITEHNLVDDKLSSSTYTGGLADITNTYYYDEYENLIGIDNGGIEYRFEYNDQGDFLSGACNDEIQYFSSYDDQGNIISKQYTNGDEIVCTYENELITGISYNNQLVFSFSYDGDIEQESYIVIKKNHITGEITRFEYEDGLLINVAECDAQFSYVYGDENNISEKYYNYSLFLHDIGYSENEITFDCSNHIKYSYDSYQRILGTTITTNRDFNVTTNLDYKNTDDNLLDSFETNYYSYDYRYDNNYNLIEVFADDDIIRYDYNGNNQLIFEEHPLVGLTYYFYDENGNMYSKIFNGDELLNVEYDESNRLIKKDNELIEYDSIGNPLNYNGYELKWISGNQLASMCKDEEEIYYSYDDNGKRISKTVNGDTTKYIYDDNKVIYEINDNYTLYYFYGLDDELIGFSLDDGSYDVGTYYYLKDGLNNIIGIVDEYGKEVVHYSYDAYGTLLGITGEKADTIGKINPYRYRQYRYDSETGWYYLYARYYEPQLGRFINADDISMLSQYVLNCNYNLYTYAYDNPVKYMDADGNVAIYLAGVALSINKFIIVSASVAIAFFAIFYPTEFSTIYNICYAAIIDFFKACKKAATSSWEKRHKSGKPHSHHIVAKLAWRAEPARIILENAGISVETDMRNRVNLKARFHQKLHTKLYYTSVNAVFQPVSGESETKVSHVLFSLKAILAAINVFQ